MKCYLLDTNIISHIVRNESKVIQKLFSLPVTAIYISVITYAEIQYGLQKRPNAKTLRNTINELLKRVEIVDLATSQTVGEWLNKAILIWQSKIQFTGK